MTKVINKMTNKEKRKIRFHVLTACVATLLTLLSGWAQANPCMRGEECLSIPLSQVITMPWRPGIRSFDVTLRQEVLFKGHYENEALKTRRKFLIINYCSSDIVRDPNSRSPNSRGPNTNEIKRRGLRLKNVTTSTMETIVRLRESYLLTPGANETVWLSMRKQVLNGQYPSGVRYKFHLEQTILNNGKICYEIGRNRPFLYLDPIFDTSEDYLDLALFDSALGYSEVDYDMGDNHSGFLQPTPSVDRNMEKDVEKIFKYALNSPVLSEEGHATFAQEDSNNGWRGQDIYDPAYIVDEAGEEIENFLSAPVEPTGGVDFWVTSNFAKLYMVFRSEPDHPIVFLLDVNNTDFQVKGDDVYTKDPLLGANMVLARLGQLNEYYRDERFYEQYGLLQDSMQEIVDLMSGKTLGEPVRPGHVLVREKMMKAYYLREFLLNRRIEQDKQSRKGVVVEPMDRQLQAMLALYETTTIQTGTPIFQNYGGEIADLTFNMLIPANMMDSVPEDLRHVNGLLSEVYIPANELRVRGDLSDSDMSSGHLVDELLVAWQKADPVIQDLQSQGYSFNDKVPELRRYINILRSYRQTPSQ